MSVLPIGDDLYFLGPQCLWWCAGAKQCTGTSGEECLILQKLEPPANGELAIRSQEFNDFVYCPARQALVVLDKSGDLFEYVLKPQTNRRWRVLRANSNKLGQPDPDYVSLCTMDNNILLLDPERNQIWQLPMGTSADSSLQGLLPGVLSWKLKPGDVNVTDAVCIRYFKGQIYLLNRNGAISKFGIKYGINPDVRYDVTPNTINRPVEVNRANGKSRLHNTFCYSLGQLYFSRPLCLCPSRFFLSETGDIFIVERANNRVLQIVASPRICRTFTFPETCDLRGLVISGNGFWIISGDHFLYKYQGQEEPLSVYIKPYRIDERLKGLILPVAGQSLPRHPGVYPGARRLYRFGVHEGLDLFNQPGAKVKIVTGTPARAACSGQVVRVDSSYKDMSYSDYNRVIRECWQMHQTSPHNEDLLRGCQVWIDSGNGLVTKYAHLSRANNKLHVGDQVKQGDTIGYVGVSGTGENLPGRIPYPHLHFEIWLDGKYLGYGLTPAETMSLFEDIFAVDRPVQRATTRPPRRIKSKGHHRAKLSAPHKQSSRIQTSFI